MIGILKASKNRTNLAALVDASISKQPIGKNEQVF